MTTNTVCELVSALARTMGLDCETTKDPAAFLDRVTPETSLILLDLMMPGMDGIEVLRLLGQRRCYRPHPADERDGQAGAGDGGKACA